MNDQIISPDSQAQLVNIFDKPSDIMSMTGEIQKKLATDQNGRPKTQGDNIRPMRMDDGGLTSGVENLESD